MTGLALIVCALAVALFVAWMGRRVYRWWRWSRTRRYLRQVQHEGYHEFRRRA